MGKESIKINTSECVGADVESSSSDSIEVQDSFEQSPLNWPRWKKATCIGVMSFGEFIMQVSLFVSRLITNSRL
jgi:hypothetical protein